MPPYRSEAELPSELPAAAVPRRVLVVPGTASRLAQIRAAVAGLRADVLLDFTDTVVDALLRTMRRPPDLLLLDLAVDDAFAPVVVRHLARVAPVTTVLVFDHHARAIPGHPTVLAWQDLEATLGRWWQACPSRAGGDTPLNDARA